MMMGVDSTAPDRPAASAKGTVSPSDMPITMSRMVSEAVKCFSTCGVWGTGNLHLDVVSAPGTTCYGGSLTLDHAVGAELVDLGLGDAEEARQDLIRVLAKQRRGSLRGPRRVPEADGHAHGGGGAGPSIDQPHEQGAGAKMPPAPDPRHGPGPRSRPPRS